ncbi:MAG TPA: thiol peroxidase [Desulfovibrio sp.]|jgi:thiol peroxidase|uniref:thiol peroxidase n=1 Tax=Desulfovibrio TaxID=872 RepID=UPI002A473689|nr:thiol peroxidase [Desulfovibrio sp.]MDY0307680.1 thiol peroxidase [Desulfovibrionaceae bacterium]HMM39212.1 thiol peroxidase [Desulfovibrio sp.]
MSERTVTFKGMPLALAGNEIKAGDKAPDFSAAANDMSPVSLKDFAGKVLILCSVPSLDTPTCDLETRRFNQEAASLGADIQILTVSMDLPFAQARWCGAAGVTAVKTLSDHRLASFGQNYGVLIRDWRLLARAVFVVGKDGVVAHAQIVSEIANEPDYAAALTAAKALV